MLETVPFQIKITSQPLVVSTIDQQDPVGPPTVRLQGGTVCQFGIPLTAGRQPERTTMPTTEHKKAAELHQDAAKSQ